MSPSDSSSDSSLDLSSIFSEIKDLLLLESDLSPSLISRIKRHVSAKYHLSSFPRHSDILSVCSPSERSLLLPHLMKRKVRTLSGVAIIAVMSRPWPCPHGQCLMCPGGPSIDRPQSYTGYEPTAMRGLRHDYDPHAQVSDRLSQLSSIGHSTDKVDIIIMGGTFTSQPLSYQRWFIKRIFDSLNGIDSSSLSSSQHVNETSSHRCVGITAETRPDQLSPSTFDSLLSFGVTRLELGVQTVFDSLLANICRGHGTAETIRSFQLSRDCGLKITAHMMPGLPGSSYEQDLQSFDILFNDPRYKPDEIKIYPTMVVPNTPLYDDWKSGKYRALTNEETSELVASIKSKVPPYVRIKRILRDIPAHQISAGPNKSDLRLRAQALLAEQGKTCRCIRCREVGHYLYKDKGDFDPSAISYVKRSFAAGGGMEHFLSYEETAHDVIIGFLRLRELSDAAFRPEFTDEPTIVIRELHVYGESVGIQSSIRDELQWQHKGYGTQLLKHAEEIGREKGYTKISVISGVGVREYYRKFNYTLDGPYMSKKL